jgi:hypothetical protein
MGLAAVVATAPASDAATTLGRFACKSDGT